MINIKEIKKICPKAYEKLRQYIANGLVEMQRKMANNVGSVKIEEIPPVDERIVEGVLVWNSRTLFDYFDSNGVYINITGDNKSWRINFTNTESLFSSRIEAEEAAYNEAFNHLEKQL